MRSKHRWTLACALAFALGVLPGLTSFAATRGDASREQGAWAKAPAVWQWVVDQVTAIWEPSTGSTGSLGGDAGAESSNSSSDQDAGPFIDPDN